MNRSHELYIIGAGGFAKEVCSLVRDIAGPTTVQGFIDVNPSNNSLKVGLNEFPVIQESFFLSKYRDVSICIGLGDPILIEKISQKYRNYNFCFPNLIHPTAICNLDRISIGEGNIITAGVVITVDVKIGSFNVFNLNSTIGHDVEILNCNVFNPSTNISGNCAIGNSNLFGVGSTILEKKRVRSNNIIGAGSVVINNITDNSTWVGVPSRLIK